MRCGYGRAPLGRRIVAPDAAFHEQLDVRRTRLVSAEAEPKRVLQVIDVEVVGAAGIRTIQERAMFNAVRHWCVTPLTHLVIGCSDSLSAAKCS
ncbi:MAG TPA: hypothetical protein VGR35_20765 [Tepidisphaeraceae bacterium]|nr:hypothetical protein [Tepidisphaeraceae bacterium]